MAFSFHLAAAGAAILGPRIWSDASRRNSAADGAAAAASACAVALIGAVAMSSIDDLSVWSIAAAGVAALAVYSRAMLSVFAGDPQSRRGRWIRASVGGATGGVVALLLLAGVETLLV